MTRHHNDDDIEAENGRLARNRHLPPNHPVAERRSYDIEGFRAFEKPSFLRAWIARNSLLRWGGGF